jgi:hypothetical protein
MFDEAIAPLLYSISTHLGLSSKLGTIILLNLLAFLDFIS